jgi:multiple sugar transport system permease protein
MSDTMGSIRSTLTRRAPALLLLIVAASLSLFPLYWLINISFSPPATIYKIPPDLITTNPTLENFEKVLSPGFYLWLIVTIAFSISSMTIHVLFDSMAAYAFAKHRFPGDRILFAMVLAALMVPEQVLLVPQFFLIKSMGLLYTFAGLLLPGLADVIGIFLLRQFMLTIPGEIIEAAKIDGASEWYIYTRIIMPLSKPALAVTAIFAFQRYWNEFLWPLVVTNKSLYTLQVGLCQMKSEFNPVSEHGQLMAGAVVSALPMMLVFFAFQRYFMQGLRVGAVKG